MIVDEMQWYVQKGSRVQGPFSTSEVGRLLLLGRVRNTDRVSRDGELWEPVTQVPDLIPEELLNLQDGCRYSEIFDTELTKKIPDEQEAQLPPHQKKQIL